MIIRAGAPKVLEYQSIWLPALVSSSNASLLPEEVRVICCSKEGRRKEEGIDEAKSCPRAGCGWNLALTALPLPSLLLLLHSLHALWMAWIQSSRLNAGTLLSELNPLLNREVLSIKDSPEGPIGRPSSNSRTSEEGFSIKFGWIPEEIEIPSHSFLIGLGRERERHQGSRHRGADLYRHLLDGLQVVAGIFYLLFPNC